MLSRLLLLSFPVLAAALPSGADANDAKTAVLRAQATYEQNTRNALRSSKTACNEKTVQVRKAWDDLSEQERQNYLRSVQCLLHKKPSRLDPKTVPGARTWNDDFVWAHMTQSNFVHNSGLLMPWHRQFIAAYEQTLRTACGYRGALPYWAWERHSADQLKSPVFQSKYFGTNGKYIPHEGQNLPLVGLPDGYTISVPTGSGTGGGCINDGVFKNIVLNLGPVLGSSTLHRLPNNTYGNHYNPRCLSRDFDQSMSTANLTYETIASLWEQQSIKDFHPLLESLGHPYSHLFVGGEGLDFYSSPNDPVFYLLHSQIDRLWTIWQGLDYKSRTNALDGTVTVFNLPPSENATLSTIMHMGIAGGGDTPVAHAMSTIDHQHCYMYA